MQVGYMQAMPVPMMPRAMSPQHHRPMPVAHPGIVYQQRPAAAPRPLGQPQVQPIRQAVSPSPRRAQEVRTPNARGGFTICEIITGLLHDRGLLKRAVLQCYDRTRGTVDGLDLDALQKFRQLISWVLEIPEEAFGDLQNNFVFFDFDGSGKLDIEETYRLIKYHLREYRKSLGGDVGSAEMPSKTLDQAGYRIIRELGRGNQGIVHLAQSTNGREVCIKALDRKTTSASTIDELQDEFKALQELACERIAAVYEIFQDTSSYYMVGEPYHGGDFLTLKQRAIKEGVDLSEEWYKGIFWQTFEAVSFMQRLAVIHCDVKEPNIMLKTKDYGNPQVVLVDFGLSRASTSKGGGCGGTPGYIPPETINSLRWYPKGDIFSLGVTLMQVVCDLSPPQGARTADTPGGIFVQGCVTLQDIMKATLNRKIPFYLLPKDWPGMERVLQQALCKNMHERRTAVQVLKDPWFKYGVPCNQANPPRRDTGITKSILLEMRGGQVEAAGECESASEPDCSPEPAPAPAPAPAPRRGSVSPSPRAPAKPILNNKRFPSAEASTCSPASTGASASPARHKVGVTFSENVSMQSVPVSSHHGSMLMPMVAVGQSALLYAQGPAVARQCSAPVAGRSLSPRPGAHSGAYPGGGSPSGAGLMLPVAHPQYGGDPSRRALSPSPAGLQTAMVSPRGAAGGGSPVYQFVQQGALSPRVAPPAGMVPPHGYGAPLAVAQRAVSPRPGAGMAMMAVPSGGYAEAGRSPRRPAAPVLYAMSPARGGYVLQG